MPRSLLHRHRSFVIGALKKLMNELGITNHGKPFAVNQLPIKGFFKRLPRLRVKLGLSRVGGLNRDLLMALPDGVRYAVCTVLVEEKVIDEDFVAALEREILATATDDDPEEVTGSPDEDATRQMRELGSTLEETGAGPHVCVATEPPAIATDLAAAGGEETASGPLEPPEETKLSEQPIGEG